MMTNPCCFFNTLSHVLDASRVGLEGEGGSSEADHDLLQHRSSFEGALCSVLFTLHQTRTERIIEKRWLFLTVAIQTWCAMISDIFSGVFWWWGFCVRTSGYLQGALLCVRMQAAVRHGRGPYGGLAH